MSTTSPARSRASRARVPAPPSDPAPGRIVKHSLAIAGHRTSISLEAEFWTALRALAAERGISLAAFVAQIDAERRSTNLSSAIRVYILADCQLRLRRRANQ